LDLGVAVAGAAGRSAQVALKLHDDIQGDNVVLVGAAGHHGNQAIDELIFARLARTHPVRDAVFQAATA
jgi:hypothetical protein